MAFFAKMTFVCSETLYIDADGNPGSLGSLVAELDDAAPEGVTPAKDALRAVLAEVFNEHDYNKVREGLLNFGCNFQ